MARLTTTCRSCVTSASKAGKFSEAGLAYWSDNILSVEAMGDMREARGKEAVRGKGVWWEDNHVVHGAEVEGPYVNGDQFAVRFKMDITINGLVMKWMQRWPFRPIANRLWMSKANSIALPDYQSVGAGA